MKHSLNDTIARLQKDILPLQGLKKLKTEADFKLGLCSLEQAFPNNTFPIGCIHEFISGSSDDIAASNGFISGLLSKLMKLGGCCVWITISESLFPASLPAFHIKPEQVIILALKDERSALYAAEEALRCNRITAVVAEISHIGFKESRRFQLAAEQSRVTGFIIRNQTRSLNTIACVSRWRITSLPSITIDNMPGLGLPGWNVELLKVRSGYTGSWKVEWTDNGFREIKKRSVPNKEPLRKVS